MTSTSRHDILRARLHRLRSQAQAQGLRVPIRLARLKLDLLTPDARLAERLAAYFERYLDRGGTPACARLWLETARLPELWEDADSDFHFYGSEVVHRDFVALREPGGQALALVNPECDDSFHNLLRWFAPRALLLRRSFLMHAAGIERDGRGYVFFGQSGAGKSTSSQLAAETDPRVRLLGDDAVIIELGSQGPVLHTAPLGCGYTRLAPVPCAVPLVGLYALNQADETRILPLETSQGVARLLASAMNTASQDDLNARFELAQGFAEATGCGGVAKLDFTRDAGFWPAVIERGQHCTSPRRPPHEPTLGSP